MGSGSLWDRIVDFFAPLKPSLQGITPIDPLIAACLLGLLAFFIVRGHKRYELLCMEIDALVRRYNLSWEEVWDPAK